MVAGTSRFGIRGGGLTDDILDVSRERGSKISWDFDFLSWTDLT